MPGRTVRLVAATAVLSFLGVSAVSAGWFDSGYGYNGYSGYGYNGYGYNGYGYNGYGYGFGGCCAPPAPPPVNWGCGNSCAPLLPSFSNCCAPVRWGCGNPCAGFNFGYGYGTAYQSPLYVANQGPIYRPPLTGYTYPVYSDDGYPYVSSGYGYPDVYRPRYGYRSYRSVYRPRVAHYRHRPYYGPRRGYYRPMQLPPK